MHETTGKRFGKRQRVFSQLRFLHSNTATFNLKYSCVATKNARFSQCFVCVQNVAASNFELWCLTCWLRFVSPFQCSYESANMHVVTPQNLLLLLLLLIWYLYPPRRTAIIRIIRIGFPIRCKQFINLSLTWKMRKIKSTRSTIRCEPFSTAN